MSRKTLSIISSLFGLVIVLIGGWLQAKNKTIFFINDVICISIGCSIIATSIYDALAVETSKKIFDFYNRIHDEFGIDKIFKNRTQPEDDCKQIIEESKKDWIVNTLLYKFYSVMFARRYSTGVI